MKLRPGDRLLLHQQAGADFDFAADAERIDALIADRLHRMRPHHLPVIVLRTLIDRLNRLPVGGKTEQIEMAIAAQVGGVKHQRRSNGLRQQREFVLGIAEPDQRAGAWLLSVTRVVGERNRSSAPLLSRSATCRRDLARKSSCLRPDTLAISAVSQLCPSFLSEMRMMAPSACTASRSRIPSLLASATAIAFTDGKLGGQRHARGIVPAARFMNTCSLPAAVNDRGVGIAVAIKIGPGKSAHAGNSGKGMNRQRTCRPRYFSGRSGRLCWRRARYRDRRRLRYPPPMPRCSAH